MRLYRVKTPSGEDSVKADDADLDGEALELILDDGTTVAYYPAGRWLQVTSEPLP